MPRFELNRKVPSCLVTKDLLAAIEAYLKVEMRQKLSGLGTDADYRISIKENIGTEILASVSEYSPSSLSDKTKEIEIRWENGYEGSWRLVIAINFDGSTDFPMSRLTVECTGPVARETAIGVGDAILRLLESHRTFNWVFHPSGFPVVSYSAGLLALNLLAIGSVAIFRYRQVGFYLLCGAAFVGWIWLSASLFRPHVSFDTRRQRLLDRVWKYLSLGTVGFVVFGTLFPVIRKALVGF
jgi:hypothetical protein